MPCGISIRGTSSSFLIGKKIRAALTDAEMGLITAGGILDTLHEEVIHEAAGLVDLCSTLSSLVVGTGNDALALTPDGITVEPAGRVTPLGLILGKTLGRITVVPVVPHPQGIGGGESQ